MTIVSKSGIATIAVATGLVLTAGTSGAVAGAMITGKQIKNNSVTTKDIKNDNLTGSDIADGSVSSADIAAADRSAYTDRGVSGWVDPSGSVTLRNAPPGVAVTAEINLGGQAGKFCLRVTGGPRLINASNATLIASPDYKTDGTSVGPGGANAIVESSSDLTYSGCVNGFQVVTLLRSGANTAQSNQGFGFQID
jgi:hypothetical protein